jgi:hypothetical protein
MLLWLISLSLVVGIRKGSSCLEEHASMRIRMAEMIFIQLEGFVHIQVLGLHLLLLQSFSNLHVKVGFLDQFQGILA